MPKDIAPSTPKRAQGAIGYAGDITPEQAWAWVQSGQAVLIDVRSDAEREWVGFVPSAPPNWVCRRTTFWKDSRAIRTPAASAARPAAGACAACPGARTEPGARVAEVMRHA